MIFKHQLPQSAQQSVFIQKLKGKFPLQGF